LHNREERGNNVRVRVDSSPPTGVAVSPARCGQPYNGKSVRLGRRTGMAIAEFTHQRRQILDFERCRQKPPRCRG
jgi:hypothetical protein